MMKNEESFQSKVNSTYTNTIGKYSNYIVGVTQTNILNKEEFIEYSKKDFVKDDDFQK